MTYDRADWHYGGDFPKGLADKCGGTHIGMFLAWNINNHLEGELHIEEWSEELEKVRKREITGTDFLFTNCDEKFWSDDLNSEGNAFAAFYYASNRYLEDYNNVLGADVDSLYKVEDCWENYDKIESVITKRYKTWKNPKKWWQFWK